MEVLMQATGVWRSVAGILGLGLMVGAGIFLIHHFKASSSAGRPQAALADGAATGAATCPALAPATRPAALAAMAMTPQAESSPANSAPILAQGKAKLDAGDPASLLAGRKILNDALN